MIKPWTQHYPKNVSPEIDLNRYQSINDLFDETVKNYRDRDAFINMGSALSFEEINHLSADFASFLQNVAKLKKGDRVAIQMPNLLQYPIVLFGALRAGLVVVNTNPLYTAREMKHQFKDSGAKAIIILANSAALLEEVLPETEIETIVITQVGDMLGFPKSFLVNSVIKYVKKMVPKYSIPGAFGFHEALDLGAATRFKPENCQPNDYAFLQYTGGTTGVSKGAILTHRNIVANVLQVLEWMKPRLVPGQEIAILPLPLYHIFSLTANGLVAFCLGGTNVMITNPRDLDTFVTTLRKYKFTFFTGINTLFNALTHHKDFDKIDFSSLKASVAGGMALQRSVAERWMELTQSVLVEGYGLTESSPVATCNPTDGTDRLGTIGLPLPSTEIALFDDNEQPVKLGEAGEIAIRGPQVMLGYWNQPEETKKVLTQSGWLKTGDVGIMDPQGFVRIVDRKKDMILVSGFNVYPNEIEDVVSSHPKVLEVAAIGVPDPHSTEAVKIFVVAKDSSLTKEELVAFCKTNLTGYKVPRHVEFRKELPKSNVGKILRRELRSQQQAIG